ncbi:MAG: transglutaminase domain-containing protein [Rhodocyclaceae bacterium]|nr:transglutaminase domain-containing protein [Rhodocyclaceae bacterium]
MTADTSGALPDAAAAAAGPRDAVTQRRKRRILILLFALAVLGAVILKHAFPSSEAVRLRNAMLVQPALAGDFSWAPSQLPTGYHGETLPPDPRLVKVVDALGVAPAAGDRARALAIAAHISERANNGGAIQSDLWTAYQRIRAGDGYCADFTQVFLGLAHAAGLFAREWAFSFDGYGGHGHAMVEVFDRQAGQWMFLDVFNNVYPLDAETGRPLSALEVREHFLGRGRPLRFERIGPGRLGFIHEEKLLAYYRRGAPEWYLWWGNDVQTQDTDPLVEGMGRISPMAGQLVALAKGEFPQIRIVEGPENLAQRERMQSLRSVLLVSFVLGIILSAWLAGELVALMRRRAG